VIPVNRVRRKYGLTGIGADFRNVLMDGDVTCFADVPEIIPTESLPATQRFIGPTPWSPAMLPPAWWNEVQSRDGSRQLVYVTLGSSGPADVLQSVLAGLADLPIDVIASMAGREETLRVPSNVRVAELLPGELACAAADLVICNGGSPSTYQALAHGKPTVGIASNMDQFLNMAAVEDAGCGRLVRSRSATAEEVRRIATIALADETLSSNARRMSRTIAGRSATEELAAIASTLARPKNQSS